MDFNRSSNWWGLALSLVIAAGDAHPASPADAATTPPPIFFDDFSYVDIASLTSHGWTVRTEVGHPGIAQAQWGGTAIQVVNDAVSSGNRLLRLEASTNGTSDGTRQAQICHQRKYLEGTFAARVRFSDAPVAGPTGDVVVQSFYVVSPLRHDFDPEFSELDWEYLPNGGWGDANPRLYGITWQTVQIDPWKAYNQAHQELGSFGGWHVLLMQIGDGKTHLYLDGQHVADHGGRNYPVVPMSLNFNQWFSPGGELPNARTQRVYHQDVDWVFHAKDQLLSPDQVDSAVTKLRQAGVTYTDTVPSMPQVLSGTCNF